MENKKLDLDSFGEIMDKFILDNDISLLINMPAGTIEPEIQDNIGMGPVMQVYILLNALPRIVTETMDLMGIPDSEREHLYDELLKLVKDDILEVSESADGE